MFLFKNVQLNSLKIYGIHCHSPPSPFLLHFPDSEHRFLNSQSYHRRSCTHSVPQEIPPASEHLQHPFASRIMLESCNSLFPDSRIDFSILMGLAGVPIVVVIFLFCLNWGYSTNSTASTDVLPWAGIRNEIFRITRASIRQLNKSSQTLEDGYAQVSPHLRSTNNIPRAVLRSLSLVWQKGPIVLCARHQLQGSGPATPRAYQVAHHAARQHAIGIQGSRRETRFQVLEL